MFWSTPKPATVRHFDNGSLVRLKSGGPLMTVYGEESFDGLAIVYAKWFDDRGHAQIDTFHTHSVEKAEPEGPALSSRD
jgi:uncharacterized protein YodC (DUF2158 family)